MYKRWSRRLSLPLLLCPFLAANDAHTLNFGAPPSADPSVKPLLGVIAGPDPVAGPNAATLNLTAQYKDIGIASVRNNDYFDDRLDMEQIFNCGGPTYPSWEGCDPNDDRFYNWAASDRQFQSWIDGGFEPFLRLGNETNCGCRRRAFSGPQNAAQEANWIIAAQRVVQRYNNWQGKTNVLRYVDIWTEWPNSNFYDRPLADFPVFWVKAFKALKAANPGLKVGGPGLLAGSTNVPTFDFLFYLFQNNAKPDWIGFHVFSADPQDFLDEARNYRQLLDGTGAFSTVPWAGSGFFRGVELICDAYNQGSRVKDANGRARTMTAVEEDQFMNHQKGAAANTAGWIALQAADIERAYYYRGDDGASEPGADPNVPNSLVGGSGLFWGDNKGTAKPKAHAFRFFSRLYREFPALLSGSALPSSVGTSRVWALGAQSQDGGSKAVLAANYSDTAADLTIQLSGAMVTAGQFPRVEMYTVDDSRDGRTPQTWTGGPFTVPAQTVVLIVFSSSTTRTGLTVTSAASAARSVLAPDSIASAFGSNLATAALQATSAALPSSLGGTAVTVRDSAGVERTATLYYVGPQQVNFVVPLGTQSGTAAVTIATTGNSAISGNATIASVAPALFSANGSGAGIAAANILRVRGGAQSYEPVVQLDSQGRPVALPIDLGSASDQTYLVLYGTGIRNRRSNATLSIGSTSIDASFAGAQGTYPGLDQVNVLLPRSLAGRGLVDLALTVDGGASNTVQIHIR